MSGILFAKFDKIFCILREYKWEEKEKRRHKREKERKRKRKLNNKLSTMMIKVGGEGGRKWVRGNNNRRWRGRRGLEEEEVEKEQKERIMRWGKRISNPKFTNVFIKCSKSVINYKWIFCQ